MKLSYYITWTSDGKAAEQLPLCRGGGINDGTSTCNDLRSLFLSLCVFLSSYTDKNTLTHAHESPWSNAVHAFDILKLKGIRHLVRCVTENNIS